MWVPFPRSIDPARMDAFIANACPSFVLRSDIVIIGLHPTSAEAVLRTDDILDDVAQRVEFAPLYIVYHVNGHPVLRHVRGPTVVGLESSSALEKIRDRDIAAVVRRPGTELPTHPRIHYQGPNGDHYRAFLRPGFGVRSIEELDRISFWLGPLLANRSSLLVDHWSMISIAYHVGQYATIEKWITDQVRVQSIRSYTEHIDALSDRIAGTFDRIESDGGAILLSVNSSGRLARNLLIPAMKQVGFHDPVIVAIASSPNSHVPDMEALTILDRDFSRQDPATCEACTRPDSILIPIPYDTYLLGLSAHVHRTAIGVKHTEYSTDLVSRYSGLGAFKTHVTHLDGRHHAYFVDVVSMLEQEIFATRAKQRVRSWVGQDIDLIVHPDHFAAKRLAMLVADELNVGRIVECNEKLHKLEQEDKDAILQANRICVVDDVVITGSRILGYRNSVNRLRRISDRDDCELYCFIGVARTPSEKALVSISDMFRHRKRNQRFLYVECPFLPNWDEKDCRWCAELRILDGVSAELVHLSFVNNRLRLLRSKGGLSTDLFPIWLGEQRSMVEYWNLGPGSIFGDVQEADLAISVASAVQYMRGKHRSKDGTWLPSELDEEFHSPISKTLDPEFFVTKRFFEPVLKASILRSTRAHDIMAAGYERELSDQLDILIRDDSFRGLWWELAIAMAVDQLPRNLLDKMAKCCSEGMDLIRSVLGSHQARVSESTDHGLGDDEH